MSEKKKFPGCFRAGCLTVVIAVLGVFVIGYVMFLSGKRLPERFVLSLQVGGPVDERSGQTVTFPFMPEKEPLALQDIMAVLDQARSDVRVRLVLIEIDGLSASPAKIGQLRRSVEQVRAAGKKVVAFLRTPEDKDYLLAAACDSVIVQRGSYLLLDGLKAELFFYTAPLKKIGIGFQAAQWKEYKSGVEPFTRTSASPQYREQVGRLLDDSFDDYVNYVAQRRGISRDSFTGIIDSLAVIMPDQAIALKLVDRVSSSWQLEKGYEKQFGLKHDRIFVSGRDYLQASAALSEGMSRDRIAVITLAGPIVRSSDYTTMGYGDGIDELTLRQSVESALEDRSVKAIVLRIDSPGGDAFAAANMLEMLDSARTKKPVVASMSGVAASGGYMVALAADKILAEPLTLTGSIGVYALKPEFSGLQEKTGLQREVIGRGRFADAYTPYKPFDGESFRKFVDASGSIYSDFTAKVAERRKMTPLQVDSLAGGRVWTGKRALAAGLVDRLGGLREAVRTAQVAAHMDTTKIPGLRYFPEQKTLLDALVDGGPEGTIRLLGRQIFRGLSGEMAPFQGALHETAVSRILIGDGNAHILALDPCDVMIR
jgi:protease-4